MNISGGHELFAVTQEFSDQRHVFLERRVGLAAIIASQDSISLENEVFGSLSDKEWLQYLAGDFQKGPVEFEDPFDNPLFAAEIEFSTITQDIFGVVRDYELSNAAPGELYLVHDRFTSLSGALNQNGEITLRKILWSSPWESIKANGPFKKVLYPTVKDVEIIGQAIQRLEAVNIALTLIP